MSRTAIRKAVSSLPDIANHDEQLDEVVMEIVVFTEGGSHVVTAPDGTLQWPTYKGGGKDVVAGVQMHEYRELSTHKFAYFALFREPHKGEITESILKHGYDV